MQYLLQSITNLHHDPGETLLFSMVSTFKNNDAEKPKIQCQLYSEYVTASLLICIATPTINFEYEELLCTSCSAINVEYKEKDVHMGRSRLLQY